MSIRRTLIGLGALAAIAAAAAYFIAPVRLFALKAMGRSPVCPMGHALLADTNLRLQIKFKDQILGSSKLVEKDPAGYHLWETPRGRWWIPQGDDYMLPFNLAEQQRQIYGTGERAVQPGDTVLDCGANIGVFTRVALDHGAKTIVAIEPAPENLESLRRNFPAEIAAGKVIVYAKGVWDKDDTLTMRRDPGNTAADSFVLLPDKNAASIQVPLTTIDKLVAELKLPRVDYIKMDIEGAETNALTGAHATLAKDHPRLSIASYHLPTDAQRIPQVVQQAWPEAKLECGPCAETRDGRVRPDVLYFH